MTEDQFLDILERKIRMLESYLIIAFNTHDFNYVEKANDVYIEIYENLKSNLKDEVCENCDGKVD